MNRLLAIDDEPELLSILRRVAENCGYETACTTRPDEFKERARTWDPTLIVLDLNMPDIDGIELLRFLGEVGTKAIVTLMSGMDERLLGTASELGQRRGLNMADPLTKPVRAADLRKMLERHKPDRAPLTTADLAKGIENDQLFLQFQPIVGIGGGVAGLEALVRWLHPERGVIAPDAFVPIAERDGLMDRLTGWVADRAIQQRSMWQAAGAGVYVSINLSAENLNELDLPDRLTAVCRQHGVLPSQVRFELTETAAMRDPTRTMDVLTRLRLKGFQLFIDDFGTGYSSFAQLRRLPFSGLKIDKSFVTDMIASTDSNTIVKAIVGLARNMGMESVAEGVEGKDVLDVLAEQGCDRAQGYHISRPMPAANVTAWLAAAA